MTGLSFQLQWRNAMGIKFSWIRKWFVPDAWAHTPHRGRSPSSSSSIRCRSQHLWPHSPKRSWSPIGIPHKSDPRSSSLLLASPNDESLAWWFRKCFLCRLCGIVLLLLFPNLCLLFLVRTYWLCEVVVVTLRLLTNYLQSDNFNQSTNDSFASRSHHLQLCTTTQQQTAYILRIEPAEQLLITFEPRLIGQTPTISTFTVFMDKQSTFNSLWIGMECNMAQII